MIHGYHVILPMYGVWLPNDPRGSWCDVIWKWELLRYPRMWAEKRWKVYLDSEEQIQNAIHYVELNPEEEGRPRQFWNFVTPFQGLPSGHVTYH